MKYLFAVFLSLITLIAPAQNPRYKNLVMEGGGVRGFAYIGAMEVLDSLGFLKNIERVGGTSAGAIQATLFAVGYTPTEIQQVINNIPLKEFNDGTLVGGITRIRKKFGFYKGDALTNWISNVIAAKTCDPDITFAQLHSQKEKGYRDLYITGTDLSYRCLRVFSYETYPDMCIRDALRISFSIPLYFQPVLIDDKGKVQTDKTMDGLHLMVDGGLLSDYPLGIFDQPQYFNCDTSHLKCKNPETLGLLLEKPDQLEYGKNNKALPISSLNEYIAAVYKTAIDRPKPDDGVDRTISISDLGIPGRVRKIPEAVIQQLMESGRQGVRSFFITRNQ
jgi:NTE family protein